MTQTVTITSGGLPRPFTWGASQAASTTTAQSSNNIYKDAVNATFQATVEGTGAVTATVVFEGTNDPETGQGVILGGRNASGASVGTTSGSPTMTSAAKQFVAALVGKEVVAIGVPAGTIVTAVAAGGASLTLSANATATASVVANFLAQNWISTPLATISLSGTDRNSDGFAAIAAWRFVRARVTAISGTGAAVRIWMGV